MIFVGYGIILLKIMIMVNTMKKTIILLIASLVLFACAKDSSSSYFYIASNEENIANLLRASYSMPEYNYAFPFTEDVLEISKKSDKIQAIYPYYPLKIDPNTETGYRWDALIDNENDTIAFNQMISKGIGFPEIEICSLPERKCFIEKSEIITQFDSDSGIFISEQLYQLFGFKDDPESLTLSLEINVPISMHYGPVDIEYQPYLEDNDVTIVNETFMLNEIDDYVPVMVTLDIEGVVSRNSSIVRAGRIGIPYELAQNIYDQATSSSVELKEGSIPWVPNTYTVVMNGDVSVDECNAELDRYISNYFTLKVSYDYNTIEESKLSQ